MLFVSIDEGNGFSKKQADEEVAAQTYSNRNHYNYFKIREEFITDLERSDKDLNSDAVILDPMITPPPGQRNKPSRSSNSGSMGPPEWPHILYERENDPIHVYM